MNTNNKILHTIKEYQMLKPGQTVIAGVSGGADSMCLLHFLCSIKKEYKLQLICAHVNHCIRGEESDRDEVFVRSWCAENAVEFKLLKVDIPGIANKNKESTELCARNMRYDFFRSLAEEESKIATAHNLDDNAETVIMNITRGTGLSGLKGVPPVRGSIIRPLLKLSRDEIEQYCKENEVPFVIDSTNNEDIYTRNKIRHSVIPVLKEINPAFLTAVSRLTDQARTEQNYLKGQANRLFEESKSKSEYSTVGYSIEELMKADEAVIKTGISEYIKTFGIYNCEEKHIELIYSAIKNKGGGVSLPNGLTALVNQSIFRITKKKETLSTFDAKPVNIKSLMKNSMFIHAFGKEYKLSIVNDIEIAEKIKFNKKLLNNLIDCDIITSNTQIRTKRSGDIYKLPYRNISKSVKKLFNEYKIPKEVRDELLLITNESEVLWVEGIGSGENSRISGQSTLAVLVEVFDKS